VLAEGDKKMHDCLITELEGSIHHYWTRSGASTITSSPQVLLP